jgi:nitrate/nitrite transport system ATP-binding protein
VGIRNIPQDYRNVARVIRLNGAGVFWKIMLPAAAPYIFSGLRIGVGLSWLAIVAAEMLIGGVGIGFFIWDAWNSSRISDIILALFYVGIVGLRSTVSWPGSAISSPAAPRGLTPRGDHHELPEPLRRRHELHARRQTNVVLQGIDLQVEQGEFIALIGHSGCGKSTVLNIVAGLLAPTAAASSSTAARSRARARPCGGVPEPLAAALADRLPERGDRGREGLPRHRRQGRARDWILHNLEMVNMGHALERLPSEISGGMKQRVGIARALAMEPKVLLLDEPFGALDALTRAHLQDEVMRIQAELKNTVLMITHDVDEAVLLSDRIVMMTNGPAATIGEVLTVDLPRPRDRIALADDAATTTAATRCCSFLYEKQRKVEPIRPAPSGEAAVA